MIFTFRANKRQVEEAATRSREKGLEEGIEIGREEGAAAREALWLEWLDQVKDKPADEWPPPPNLENGKSNGQSGN